MSSLQNKSARQEAVLYARVSSKEQEKGGFSIPAQLKLLKKYAEENGFEVVQEYVDVETAKKSGRTGFTEMIKFLHKEAKSKKSGHCRTLLVEKTDRLYRNLKDWVTLDELDLEIHFVKENVILSQDSRSSEKFMHGIKVLMAKNYIDNLSEETKKGMLEKAEQGIYPSAAPMGYMNVECQGKRFIQPDPSMAPIIVQLFEWYATGNYSLSELTKKAQAEGLAYRKTNSRIPKSALHKFLKNPIYYGVFMWDGKLYEGVHEPIVSKELFDRVQEVMAEKGRRKTRQQKHDWAFRGMVSCGHCGCALTAEIKKGKYVYYHCTGYKGRCPEKYVREEEIARQFGLALRMIHLDQEVLEWVIAALKESHADEKQYHDKMIAKLQSENRTLQARLDGMYVDKLDGRITQAFYDKKSFEWRQEQDDLLRKIGRHQNANRAYIAEGIRLLELSQHAAILYEKQEMKEKGRLARFVFSNSIWKDGRLQPNYRKPFDLIAQTNLAYQKRKAVSSKENGLIDFWLPNTTTQRIKIVSEKLDFFFGYRHRQRRMEFGNKPAYIAKNKVPTMRDMAAATTTGKKRNPIQEAMEYKKHLEKSSTKTYKEVGVHFGVTNARVCQMLTLLKKLPQEILDPFLDEANQGAVSHITERRLRPLTRMDSDAAKVLKFKEMSRDCESMLSA